MLEELEPRWESRCESERHDRRRDARRRQAGAGLKYELAFHDRLVDTLAYLRTGLSQDALAVVYDVGSSTIGRATGEIRPLLAARGFAVPDRPGLRLRTLEDVFAYTEDPAGQMWGYSARVRSRRARWLVRVRSRGWPFHQASRRIRLRATAE